MAGIAINFLVYGLIRRAGNVSMDLRTGMDWGKHPEQVHFGYDDIRAPIAIAGPGITRRSSD
jgi:hypothetical protein